MPSTRSCRLGSFALLVVVLAVGPDAGAQFWEVGNVLLGGGEPQPNAYFGWTVAVGDFDDDGIDDVVVAAPFWDSATVDDAGAWWTYRGARNRQLVSWGRGTSGATDNEEAGRALATGDFDGDGRDEIAVGRPRADVQEGDETRFDAGKVSILHLSGSSFTTGQVLSELDAGSADGPETYDDFGLVLAAGNFNGDGYADLAVGVPQEDLNGVQGAGCIHVFFGGPGGLRTDVVQTLHAGSVGVIAGSSDNMGAALASGDFDDDGYDDLAVGAPGRDVSAVNAAGQVHVIFGSSGGLVVAGAQLFSETDFPGAVLASDARFGATLAAGNIDLGGFVCFLTRCYADLVIGIPGWNFFSDQRAGRLIVAYGSAAGVSTSGSTNIHQLNNGEIPEAYDQFASALAVGQVDGEPWQLVPVSYDDIVVGAFGEDLGDGLVDAGLIQTFFGSTDGADQGRPEQLLPLEDGFGAAPARELDWWGDSLALGDLDGDGWGDLVAGIPYRDVPGAGNAGKVQVLFGALFADGFESGTTDGWSAVTSRAPASAASPARAAPRPGRASSRSPAGTGATAPRGR